MRDVHIHDMHASVYNVRVGTHTHTHTPVHSEQCKKRRESYVIGTYKGAWRNNKSSLSPSRKKKKRELHEGSELHSTNEWCALLSS